MQVVRVLLIILEALVSLLLIGVILLQRARNEGLGLAFGSGMGESIFGSRAGNVLTKITVWLGSIFVVNTVVLAMLYSGVNGDSTLMSEEAPVPVPVEAPVTPAAPVDGAALEWPADSAPEAAPAPEATEAPAAPDDAPAPAAPAPPADPVSGPSPA